jgi:hypothetical protein
MQQFSSATTTKLITHIANLICITSPACLSSHLLPLLLLLLPLLLLLLLLALAAWWLCSHFD